VREVNGASIEEIVRLRPDSTEEVVAGGTDRYGDGYGGWLEESRAACDGPRALRRRGDRAGVDSRRRTGDEVLPTTCVGVSAEPKAVVMHSSDGVRVRWLGSEHTLSQGAHGPYAFDRCGRWLVYARDSPTEQEDVLVRMSDGSERSLGTSPFVTHLIAYDDGTILAAYLEDGSGITAQREVLLAHPLLPDVVRIPVPPETRAVAAVLR
jgi:hypothetical protein